MSLLTKEYRELDQERLIVKINNLERDYRLWREAVISGKEKNHAKIGFLRKEIARAKTVLSEKQSITNNQ